MAGVYFKIFLDLIFSKKPFDEEGTPALFAPVPLGQEERMLLLSPASDLWSSDSSLKHVTKVVRFIASAHQGRR